MTAEALNPIIELWRELGVGFTGAQLQESSVPIDLERLVIRTIAGSIGMARLFSMANTWLHLYGDLVAKHRLRRLIQDELDPEFHPVLGLLLDTAQQGQHPQEFRSVIADLRPAKIAQPLFAVERRNDALIERANRTASPIARRWRLWTVDQPFKFKALHSAQWIMQRHPDFVVRADMRGDLRVSVLAALRFDTGAGDSEMALARAAGGSRAQVRNALENLEMTGRVRRVSALSKPQVRGAQADSPGGNRNATRIELLRFG